MQAEAPPGELFLHLKEALLKEVRPPLLTLPWPPLLTHPLADATLLSHPLSRPPWPRCDTRQGCDGTNIAFYFVHWLTDLAGAEPTPLQGLEKFVLKFPTPVLLSLVSSMALVQRLADTTPTALMLE